MLCSLVECDEKASDENKSCSLKERKDEGLRKLHDTFLPLPPPRHD